jgi:hypothetical protein
MGMGAADTDVALLLRRRRYKHPSREITDILELLALSRAEGLDVARAIDDLLAKIAIKSRAA